MFRRMRGSLGRARGASTAEYMVMVILGMMVLVAMIRLFGGTAKDKLQDANDEISRSTSGKDAARPRDPGTSRGAEAGRIQNATAPEAAAATSADSDLGANLGGFNPLVLFVVLGLVGALVYVMFAKREG